MPALGDVLERLNLTTYRDALVANGFHNWETVLDITEEDLIALTFKLGHRRALQREIATWRGVPSSLALEAEGIVGGAAGSVVSSTNTTPQPSLSTSSLEMLESQTATPPAREKRRYRRHPRPDVHAPKKPKTACTSHTVHYILRKICRTCLIND